jgi:hypothetical protein
MIDTFSRLRQAVQEVANSKDAADSRRVLVLEGGGAKGAYAFGSMLAFARTNIRFKSVAGTSVGALNAILWCTNSMDAGWNLWRSISFASVYPVRFCDPQKYSRAVITALSCAYVVLRLAWATATGAPTILRSWNRVVLSLVLSTPWIYLIWLLSANHHSLRAILLFGSISAMISGAFGGSLADRHYTVVILMTCYVVVPSFLVAQLATGALHSRGLGILIGFCTFSLAIVVCGLVFLLLSWLFEVDKSVLESSPLRESILKILSNSTFSIPAIVTIARERDIFDPDTPEWYPVRHDETGMPLPPYYPATRKKWRAAYYDIGKCKREIAVDYCMASAALPYGIAPPVKIGDQRCVDGGVADNCPVFPFLNGIDIEEVFIVLHSAYDSDQDALNAAGVTVETWQKRRREYDIGDFPTPSEYHTMPPAPFGDKNRPPKVIPYRTPRPFPACVPFYPSKSIGNLLSGTLNFEGRFAQVLIWRGYRETRSKLKRLGYWHSPSESQR